MPAPRSRPSAAALRLYVRKRYGVDPDPRDPEAERAHLQLNRQIAAKLDGIRAAVETGRLVLPLEQASEAERVVRGALAGADESGAPRGSSDFERTYWSGVSARLAGWLAKEGAVPSARAA